MQNKPDEGIELIERGWCARAESKYAEAHRDMIKTIAIFRQAGTHGDLVAALGRLGHIEMDLDRWDEERSIYEKGISICRDAGDPFGMAHKIRHLGMVHRHAGREDEARACFQEALSPYRSHKEPPSLDYANATLPVARLKEELGQVDQAKQLLIEARKLYLTENVQAGVDDCSNRLAKLSQ